MLLLLLAIALLVLVLISAFISTAEVVGVLGLVVLRLAGATVRDLLVATIVLAIIVLVDYVATSRIT